MSSPSLSTLSFTRDRAGLVVDVQLAGADDANLAHLAAHQRGVRTDAAHGCENALRGLHAADVFGRGLLAHQDDLGGRVGLLDGLSLARVEADDARRSARPGGNALGEQLALGDGGLFGGRFEHRLQELIQVARLE